MATVARATSSFPEDVVKQFAAGRKLVVSSSRKVYATNWIVQQA